MTSLSFNEQLKGRSYGILRWHQLDTLWQTIKSDGKPWYFYQIGAELPTESIQGSVLDKALNKLDQLLHQEHDYDFCGVVYVDNIETPRFIKVYDPNNLGSSCGCSGQKHYPRWVISQTQPDVIKEDAPVPNNRKRWWNKLFS